MTSLGVVLVGLGIAPPVGGILALRLSTEGRSGRAVRWFSVAAVPLLAASIGLRLWPPPVGGAVVSLAAWALWAGIFTLRPRSGSGRLAKVGFGLCVAALLLVHYLITIVSLFGMAPEPELREELSTTIVAYAFRSGGATLDYSGYDVQVRRTLPWIGIVEYIGDERGYASTTSPRGPAPRIALSGEEGSRAIVIDYGAGAPPEVARFDTIRLD